MAAASVARLGDQRSAHHEGFFVGQRDALPAVERRECRVEAGSADDGIEDNVDVRPHGGLDQALRPGAPFVDRCVTPAGLVVHDADVRRMKAIDLFPQERGIRVCSESGDAKPVGVSR
jgi:hypothetical protein